MPIRRSVDPARYPTQRGPILPEHRPLTHRDRQALAGGPAAVVLALLGAACGGPQVAGVVPGGDPCVVVTEPGASRADTIFVALAGPVRQSGLGEPRSLSERIIARQLTGDAPALDCLGRERVAATATPFRLDSLTLGSPDLIQRLTLIPLDRQRGRTLAFEVLAPEDDLRDLLDRPADTGSVHRPDLMVATDRATVSYAGSRGGYRTIALAWDRTYVLLSNTGMGLPVWPTLSARQALAADAVRGDVRGAEPPFWWEAGLECAPRLPRGSGVGGVVIGYPAGDAIARDLAERVVALTREPLRTLPFTEAGLDSGLPGVRLAGLVLPLSRSRPATCEGRPRPPGSTIAPLVDARAYLLAGPLAPTIRLEADGTFLVLPGPLR